MNHKSIKAVIVLLAMLAALPASESKRARDYGIIIGTMKTGPDNSITDVQGVKTSHVTLNKGNDMRTGVTAILPHEGNIFQQKVPAAIYIANGFGKLAGYSQVEELGNIETPIILTNTLSVPAAADALIDYTLSFEKNKNVRSVNPVVGETNDGRLNNIQARYVKKNHVIEAIKNADSGPVPEGCIGAGTGTICFGYKGGIGTSSRILPKEQGGWTVGVLVQTNYGGSLKIAGINAGSELKKMKENNSGDGSCMIVIATDAPLRARNLKRLAKRAVFGIAQTGGNCSNGSGEYVIAFSTAEELRIPYSRGSSFFVNGKELRNDRMTPLFEAVIEAVEEAVINSLFAAKTMQGRGGLIIEALPLRETLDILKSHNVIRP